jgi:hypothetical protein
MNRVELPQELKSRAFDLMSSLGMTIENRKFHSFAQIGYPHEGYCRYAKEHDEKWALYSAVTQCADSYYLKNPDQKESFTKSTEQLHDAYIQCANLAGKVAELQAQLAEKTERLTALDNLKLAGYIVRGTFFKSQSDAQKMADNSTEYYENAFVDPVYTNSVSENTSPLHEIHRAYGVQEKPKEKMYYMRDNMTFLDLGFDFSEAKEQILNEFAKGFSYGTFFHGDKSIPASGKDNIDKFLMSVDEYFQSIDAEVNDHD